MINNAPSRWSGVAPRSWALAAPSRRPWRGAPIAAASPLSSMGRRANQIDRHRSEDEAMTFADEIAKRLSVAAALFCVALLGAGDAGAQERTQESAITFIALFTEQKTPAYTYYNRESDASDLWRFSRRTTTWRFTGTRQHPNFPTDPCRTQFLTDRNPVAVNWAAAKAHRFTFDTAAFPAAEAPRPFITIERGGDLGTLAIWAGDDGDTRRLWEAMTFLADSCNAMSQTGF